MNALLTAQHDWLDYFLVFVQVSTLIALIIYVWKTWEMASATRASVDEMAKTRMDETRPYVLLVAERSSESFLFIDLVLRNFGRTAARNVTIKFTPELQATWEGLSKCAFLSSPVPFLAPGAELRTFFDSGRDYFNQDLPGHYMIEISYVDEKNQTNFTEQLVLNVEQFKGMTWIETKDLGDIHKVIDSVRRSLDGTTKQLSEIDSNLRRGLLTITSQTDRSRTALSRSLEGIAATALYFLEVASGDRNMVRLGKDAQRLLAWKWKTILLEWDMGSRSEEADEAWKEFSIALNAVVGYAWVMGDNHQFITHLQALKLSVDTLIDVACPTT